MRTSIEEPTGMCVRGPDGEEVLLTFSAFVAAIEEGRLHPEDWVRSRIVTDNQWVRAADMRLYALFQPVPTVDAEAEPTVWPPPPQGE